jgi:hypothetical protein
MVEKRKIFIVYPFQGNTYIVIDINRRKERAI